MKITVSETTKQDIETVECTAEMRQELHLFASLSSFVYSGRADDTVAIIWGLIPPSLLSSKAHLWMYSTDLCEQHPFLLVRYSQRVMADMLKKYPTIVGFCDIRQRRSRQWLTWLGAQVGPPTGFLAPFSIKAKHG